MKHDYKNYTVNDFLQDDYFLQFLSGSDEKAIAFWTQWINENPDRKNELEKAIKSYSLLTSFNKKYADKDAYQSVWNNVLTSIEQKNTPVRRLNTNYLRRIAAAIILGSFLALLAYYYKVTFLPVELLTRNGEVRTVLLPDSSVITLNANSKLKYYPQFTKNNFREVWVDGEAFFNITHRFSANGARMKFIVHTSDLNVEVLGTTFNVKRRRGISEVVLNTGKIRLSFKDEKQLPVQMKPGQKVEYVATQHKLTQTFMKNLAPVIKWKDKLLVFDQTPLSEVAKMIEDVYGYKVVITDSNLIDQKVSGTLNAPTDTVLVEAFSTMLDIKISKKDNTLIFSHKN